MQCDAAFYSIVVESWVAISVGETRVGGGHANFDVAMTFFSARSSKVIFKHTGERTTL